jgi:hypothetical protein
MPDVETGHVGGQSVPDFLGHSHDGEASTAASTAAPRHWSSLPNPAMPHEVDMGREVAARRRAWALGASVGERMAGRGLSPDEVVAEWAAIEIGFVRAMTGAAGGSAVAFSPTPSP